MSSIPAPGDRRPVVLFLHLPKTAGRTLSALLFRQLQSPALETDRARHLSGGVYYYPGPHQASNYGFFKEPAPGLPAHVPAMLARRPRAVLGHFAFGLHRHLEEPATYVTFLRNPVDRVQSLYRQLRPEGGWERFLTDFRVPGYAPDQTRLVVDNDQTRRISGEEPPFGGCDGALLARAKRNLETHFAAVGVTDRFDESVVVLAMALGWDSLVPYWPANMDVESGAEREVDPDTAARILERNALDLELYEFGRELLARRIERLGDAYLERLAAFREMQRSVFRRAAERDPETYQAASSVLRRVGSEARALRAGDPDRHRDR
jgi:hypothetical protein